MKKELVLVETVLNYRIRYVVEVPAGKADWALDTVVCEEATEFSQEFLGETIVSHRVIDAAEAIKLCDQDNSYAQSWSTEHKVKTFITPIKE